MFAAVRKLARKFAADTIFVPAYNDYCGPAENSTERYRVLHKR